jgi:hypothetical protein
MKKPANKLSIFALATVLSLGAVLSAGSSAAALSLMDVINGDYRGTGQPAELFNGPTALIPRAINLMLFVVGILAIFMLIWGGIRYVISGGDQQRVKDAKNTILYAIIGLVVAILGYAVVQWVIGVVGAGAGAGGGTSV